MTCRQIRRLLSVRREWTAREQSMVGSHLPGCPSCQAVAREYELMDRRLGRLPESKPVAALPSGVQARMIVKEQMMKGQTLTWPRRAIPGLALVVIIAAIAVAALVWRGQLSVQISELGLFRASGPPTTTPLAGLAAMPDIEYPLEARLGEEILFLGYDVGQERVVAGENLHLTLYWQAVTEIQDSYVVFAHLQGEDSRLWAQRDGLPQGGALPTTIWVPGQVVVDEYEILIGTGTPPDDYFVAVGMYRPDTGQRLPVTDERGELLGDQLLLDRRFSIVAAGPPPAPDSDSAGSDAGRFIWPVAGTLTQIYWPGHTAVDVANLTGTPVYAAADGVVAQAGRDEEHGNFILLEHGDGYETFYSHLRAIYAKAGEPVSQGQQIGEVGATGKTTGPHLHFEIHKDGVSLDPFEVIAAEQWARKLVLDLRVYGIQAYMLDQDHVPIVEAVQELGFGWVKQQINWAEVEPHPGEFQWDELDRAVQSVDAAGLNLLLNVVGSPRWAWPDGTDYEVMGPPVDLDDFAAFMSALAVRYQGRIGAYEIWQAQNINWAWGGQISAKEYVELLRVAYEAIKKVDSQALVVSGGLTPSQEVRYRSKASSVANYLGQMYAAGLVDACDVVGAHLPAYNLPPDVDWKSYEDSSARFRAPFELRHSFWSFQGTAKEYHRVMEEYDDPRPLWVTEFGWAVDDAPREHYEFAADNTPQEQVEFTLRALEMAREWDWVEAMFLWNLNFSVVAPDSEKALWSIVEPDWERGLTFEALAEVYRTRGKGGMLDAVTSLLPPSQVSTGRFVWPTAGHISQTYSDEHHALDIASQAGTPVCAAADGVVILSAQDEDRHGIHPLLDHGDGYTTFYSHLSAAYVEAGEEVKRGQKIGTVGSTGLATGPHLHFEIRQDGEYLNPLEVLP